ncbi:AraC family transcriptional regulator [Aquibium sp. A9E412]|uniref:AraC family transcriptional regulator n=1 Tax=Aquibium sp. A9E412 TaxID=2976767 RepID=UPI0025AF5E48|nr:AraC family transcriptional regulator [Aquibium sp. A9E412]MDN2567617.1 AraC family transcriptional regulator [Aquibium sp. A9E412]
MDTRPDPPPAAPRRRPRYRGEAIRPAAGERYGWHSHDFGQLVSATSGSMYVGTRDRVLLLSAAMAIWIPPDAEHWMRYGANNAMLYVDVNRREAARLGARCRVVAMTPLLAALLSATLPDSARARSAGHEAALHGLLRRELVAAREVPLSVVMPRDRRLRAPAQAALDDPGAIGPLEAWLAGVAASRKTVERLFVAETGLPPSRWLRQVRLLHAIARLSAGEKVGSVAFDMGYGSSSAFGYMFRRALGVSPGVFCGDAGIRRRPRR